MNALLRNILADSGAGGSGAGPVGVQRETGGFRVGGPGAVLERPPDKGDSCCW